MRDLSIITRISLIVFLILCLAQSVSADQDELDVQGTIIPGDVVSPGQTVSAQYTISYDFDSDDEYLQLYTDLQNPKWMMNIVIDGVGRELPSRTGRYVYISGFELYYPGTHSSSLVLVLNGTVPEVTSTENYTIFSVDHYGYDGSIVDEEIVEAVFVNPSDISVLLDERKDDLSALRNYLDEKSLLGVDMTSAEVKYGEASEAIYDASVTDSASAMALLSYAEACIDESYSIADRAWAEYSIDRVNTNIGIVDTMVTGYENKGLSDDSRVWVIRSYLDNARTLIVLAEDKFEYSEYEAARDYSGQAQSKVETACNYADALNDELGLDSSVISTVTVSSTTSYPVQTSTVTSTSSSVVTSGKTVSGSDDNGGFEDIDDILHSEVSLDSAMEIGGAVFDLFIQFFDFLNGVIASASDN